MTVARLENNGQDAVCGWFVNKKPQLRTIPVVMLKIVDLESDSGVYFPREED
jgi:hypothetical protein